MPEVLANCRDCKDFQEHVVHTCFLLGEETDLMPETSTATVDHYANLQHAITESGLLSISSKHSTRITLSPVSISMTHIHTHIQTQNDT